MTSQGVALLDTDRAEFGVIDGVLPGDLSVSLDENQPGGTGAQSGIVSLAVDGTVNIPNNLNSAMGQVFTDANIDDFVAAVNSGATGLIGLQISTDGQALELGAMSVVSGQDVRVFSTASDTTLTSHFLTVATGGMLTINGTVQLTDFFLVSASWLSVNAGTVAFDGGVTAVLPDGTAPSISGSIPGTLTAEWGGSTVVSIARSDSSVTASFTPSDWSAVQWFGDANVDDFVAAVNSGATGLIGLQVSTDGQALELGVMSVVSGQDVRVFSTASDTTLTSHFLTVATGGMLTISGTVQLTDFFLVSASWLSVNAGTVAFDGGVTAVLPDGTAPSISGSIPGTLTAEWGGSTVVSIARSDSSATASFTPSDWSAVQWFGDANVDDFVAAVNSGATGLIGLQISTDGQALELGAMDVVSGQDVRVFSTASDTTLTSHFLTVATGGMLTISGTVQLTDFFLVSASWLSVNAGTVAFDGGVTAVLPDGTAPSISGSIPGTLTAEWGGSTVVSIARSDSSATASFTPSDWSAVQWFGDANVDDFVAAVNSGATGLIGLQISTDGQALELGAMDVVSGQDVRVFSTASDTTLAFAATTFPKAQVANGGALTTSGPIQITDTSVVSTLMLPSANAGTVSFYEGVSVVRADGTTPTLSGTLPGTLTAMLNGATVGTVTRADGGDPSVSPSAWADEVELQEWVGDETNYDGNSFVIYLLQPVSLSDTSSGRDRYWDTCASVGLRPVGCSPQGNFRGAYNGINARSNPAGMVLPPSFNCNVNRQIADHTGWTDFVNLDYSTSLYLVGFFDGSDQGNSVTGQVWSRMLHPICGREL
eukprot:COSAG06_NODE_1959_length_7980_cov_19.961426_6_plen_825_part_00